MFLRINKYALLASRTCGSLTRRFQKLGKKLVMTLMTWVVERMLLLGSGNIVIFCFFYVAILVPQFNFTRNLTLRYLWHWPVVVMESNELLKVKEKQYILHQ
jgi:hypothetical protein